MKIEIEIKIDDQLLKMGKKYYGRFFRLCF